MPEFNRVRDDLAFGVGLDKHEAPIGIQGRANVEAFLSAEVPRVTGARFGMDEDTTTNWSEGSLVEVKRALKVFPRGIRELRVACQSRLRVSSACGRSKSQR
jgi:hypothetical protein